MSDSRYHQGDPNEDIKLEEMAMFEFSAPRCLSAIVHYKMSLRREALEEIRHRIIRCRGESQIDIREQRIPTLPSQFLSQELYNSLKPIVRRDLIKVILHYWSVADCFKADYDFSSIPFLVTL